MNHQIQTTKKVITMDNKKRLIVCAIGILVLCTVGCEEQELISNWLNREIIIDAKSDDWLDTLYYFESEMVSLGFFNDENHLYVCMLAEHPILQAQVVSQGFTLWFDPAGGKEKAFGIKFPIGMRSMREQMDFMRTQEGEQDREKVRRAFEQSLANLEILGPGGTKKRIPVEETKGIEIKARNETGLFVYELKVPLKPDEKHPFAIGADAGTAIGVGLEIPEIDRNEMRSVMQDRMGGQGGMPPGGGGGRMGGMGGGMGRRGGQRPKIPKGLDVWATLQLSLNQIQELTH
ncbi:MAG: hypothetical protein PVI66_16515 [Candidatus Aminicenantes bacterium]|jgi:hypothetical protein